MGRHVAKEKAKVTAATGKPVYGLFMARSIDTNTAETFRLGVWYQQDDKKMNLEILPQFIAIFENGFNGGQRRINYKMLEELINSCQEICSTSDAPSWKQFIDEKINNFANELKETS